MTIPAQLGAVSRQTHPRSRCSPGLKLVSLLGLVLLLLACSSGRPTDPQGVTYVAPDGSTTILYDPPGNRGEALPLSGDDLLAPGSARTSTQFGRSVIVINIWGSWCGPCRAESPELENVQRRTRELGVQFLGINVRDDRAAAADFVRDRAISYPSIYDFSGRSLLALRGIPRNVVPSTIVLDRAHRVAAVYLRAVLAADIEPIVRRIALEAQPDGPATLRSGPVGSTGPTEPSATATPEGSIPVLKR